MSDYQTALKKSLDQIKQDSKTQEQVIEAQVQQRLVQLQEQVKNKKQLQNELKQIRSILATGSLNGQKLEKNQLEQLQKSEKDLTKLAEDPTYIKVMANTAKTEQLAKIRKNESDFITKVTQETLRLNRCGCAVERVQSLYSIDQLGDRIKLEVTGQDGIFKEVKTAYEQCPVSK